MNTITKAQAEVDGCVDFCVQMAKTAISFYGPESITHATLDSLEGLTLHVFGGKAIYYSPSLVCGNGSSEASRAASAVLFHAGFKLSPKHIGSETRLDLSK